jgi:hypothetical protein
MKTTSKTHTAWAIKIKWADKSWERALGSDAFFCGVYYFAWHNSIILPQFFGGCTTAIFKTRETAREHCRLIRNKNNNAQVVKVSIEITEML